MPGSAPGIIRSLARLLPDFSLMTTVLPPMALALPWRMLAAVVPPARPR
jgi:hypothetical protein